MELKEDGWVSDYEREVKSCKVLREVNEIRDAASFRTHVYSVLWRASNDKGVAERKESRERFPR